MSELKLIGECMCCAPIKREAEMKVETYGEKVEIKITDCMGRARILFNKEDKKFLKLLAEILGE